VICASDVAERVDVYLRETDKLPNVVELAGRIKIANYSGFGWQKQARKHPARRNLIVGFDLKKNQILWHGVPLVLANSDEVLAKIRVLLKEQALTARIRPYGLGCTLLQQDA
jgi:hypothetical protein